MRDPHVLIRSIGYAIVCAIVFAPAIPRAQDLTPATQPPLLDASPEQPGMVAEPDMIRRAAAMVDRRFNSTEITEGPYANIGNMIPGGGWISAGPGYRRWYQHDHVFVDSSAVLSWRGYTFAQSRAELPRLARGRVLLGATASWHDFRQVDFFGAGPTSTLSNRSQYDIRSKIFGGYAAIRPVRSVAVNGQFDWLKPSILPPSGLFKANLPYTGALNSGNPEFGIVDQPTFLHREVSITMDARNFPGHPTAGAVYRGVVADYSDRGVERFNFKRYEVEAARFARLTESGVVLALHGWLVASDPVDGQAVPFYFQPSLGGFNTLRDYTDYRFHDRDLLLVNAEVRVPLMTHVDAAPFLDLGNVAPRLGDLDLSKHSYGVGLRLHTTRQTFVRFDVARGGDAGWMFLLRLSDPLDLTRLTRQTAIAPFVP